MWHHLSEPADVKRFVDSTDTFFVDYDGWLVSLSHPEPTSEPLVQASLLWRTSFFRGQWKH
jgi:hypothetical protein